MTVSAVWNVYSLSPLNMPDYAEVAGCSTFKNTQSPLYDSFGAYATTNVMRNINLFANPHYPNTNKNNSVYSAPNMFHYNSNDTNVGGGGGGSSVGGGINNRNFMASDANFTANGKTASPKMNIIENKMEAVNNLNRSSASVAASATGSPATSSVATDTTMVSIKSVPSTPLIGMYPRIKKRRKINFNRPNEWK